MAYDTFKRDLCQTWLAQHYQPLCNLHAALQKISLNCFKMMPQRKIHLCQNLESALQLLEKWKLLSSSRLDIVIKLSDLLHGPTESIKIEIRKMNPRYDSVSFCQCFDNHFIDSNSRNLGNAVHRPNTPICETRYAEVYSYLSENLGLNQNWIDLGRMLPGMRSRTDELRSDHTLRQKDKIILLLEEFELSCVEENVLPLLLLYLEKGQFKRQSDFIKEKFLHLF